MKYLPLRDFENVTSALNFDTVDCQITGGCDLYTTKAAGSDKKLYKTIENSLETQHEELVRLSASLSPPQSELFSLNLSRPSPFGSLNQISSRRTFTYLIATLNASHPDYDFSHELKTSDFHRERSLRGVINTIDETLYNLRPRKPSSFNAGPSAWASHLSYSAPQISQSTQTWGPKMWKMIDKEMTLRECQYYSYSPDEDPFEGEENALWSLHYFFFNKRKKRVCYLYLRGLSISSHTPLPRTPTAGVGKSPWSESRRRSSSASDLGASKRATYWLGDKAGRYLASGYDLDDEVPCLVQPGDDEVDVDVGYGPSDYSSHDFTESEEDDEIERLYRGKSAMQGISEHIMESMEV